MKYNGFILPPPPLNSFKAFNIARPETFYIRKECAVITISIT